MTQQYFDMAAVVVAQVAVFTGKTEEQVFEEIMTSTLVKRAYDDTLESAEVVKSAKRIREILKEFFPIEETSENFTQLKFCVRNYKPDGRKRRKRLFGGTKFNYEKSPINNLAENCVTNMTCYVFNTYSGTIPIHPNGWKP